MTPAIVLLKLCNACRIVVVAHLMLILKLDSLYNYGMKNTGNGSTQKTTYLWDKITRKDISTMQNGFFAQALPGIEHITSEIKPKVIYKVCPIRFALETSAGGYDHI